MYVSLPYIYHGIQYTLLLGIVKYFEILELLDRHDTEKNEMNGKNLCIL